MNKVVASCVSVFGFALIMATSTVTFSGCDSLLAVGDTIRDTVSVEKLSVPTIDSVVVLEGAESAEIHFSGSHVLKENFRGYFLLSSNSASATIIEKDSVIDSKAWTGTRSFTVPIKRDGMQTFWIAAYNKGNDRGQPVPAHLYGRLNKEGTISRFTVNSTDDGLDVDGVPEIKTVEDGIRADGNPVMYATNSGADFIVEEPTSTPGSLCITPIGGAVVFKSNATDIYTKAEINDIYEKSYQKDITSLSSYDIDVFAQGKSIRSTPEASGAIYSIKKNDYFIVITSAKNVARVKVEATSGKANATLVIYQDSGRNAGELLYKKAL